jgi:hypothetical protein
MQYVLHYLARYQHVQLLFQAFRLFSKWENKHIVEVVLLQKIYDNL